MPPITAGASLLWKPNFLSPTRALKTEGLLSAQPYASREAALKAVEQFRKKHGGAHDSAFLVVPGAQGWVASRFSEKDRFSGADAPELKISGGVHPQAFVVDAQGRIATLQASKTPGQLELKVVSPDAFHALKVAEVGKRVLPMITAQPQVNHGRNVTWSPKIAFQPGRDIEQLSDIMKWVDTTMPPVTKVKAGGSRHSWSAAAATDSVYIQPEQMGFIALAAANPIEALRLDLPKTTRDHLVRVGAGTTIRELNRDLWGRGLAMPALGGFDGQTIAGVLPTGTHGSVLGRGPLAETVRSVDLVKPNGDKVRIEPQGGPTNADEFKRTHPGWTLIQQDATFDASLINLGTMGVVHSYMLEVRDKFYLNEVRTKTTGKKAQEILRGGNVYNLMENPQRPPVATHRAFPGHPAKAFHLELLWNPHSDRMVVTSRQPVSQAEHKKLSAHEPADFSRPSRDLIRTLTADDRYSRPQVGTALTDFLTDVVGDAHRTLRKLVPDQISAMVDSALDSMVDKQYTQRSYNVFNIGDGANHLPAQSATLSVPLRDDGYLKAMDVMRQVAAKFAKENNQWQTGPISLRFVKGSRASLGDPEDSCKFEIIFSGNAPADQKLARELTSAYYAALHKELGDDVRFHWGQIPPDTGQSPATLKAAYPRFEEFNRIRRDFDPTGKMLNAWQQKLFG